MGHRQAFRGVQQHKASGCLILFSIDVLVLLQLPWSTIDGPGQAEGRLFAGRPADDHWMNSPSSGQHTAHYSPVIIAPFVAWGRRGSLPLFFWRGGREGRAVGVSTDAKPWHKTRSVANRSGLKRPVKRG